MNAQSYPNVEHVFIDGGSRDTTLSLIQSGSCKKNQIISEADNGIYDALNKGLRYATGDVVGFLHADDFFPHHDVLAHIAKTFVVENCQAVYGDLQYVSQTNIQRVIRHWRTQPFSDTRLRRGWMPPHPTLYVRRKWYEKIGGFDDSYRIASDYHSILRLFSRPDFDAAYIPEVLVKMRVGGASNRSLRNILQKSSEDYRALRETGVGGITTLALKNLRKSRQFIPRASE